MIPTFLKSPWGKVAALYLALAALYGWPIFVHGTSALPSDTGDPGLNAWIVWWNAHAVPLTQRWWDAPIFFPAKGAFALSETLLGIAPLTTPLQWLGVSPVLAYNIAYLLSFPAAAFAAHALAYRLTGRHDAALLAGLAFGFNPYRATQMPHIQLMWSCWMPLGLLALHRYISDRRPRDLWLLGTCWLLNALTSGYYVFFFSTLVGLWIVWFVRSWRDLAKIAVTLALATLPVLPLMAGYARIQDEMGLRRDAGEIVDFSADLRSLWVASPNAWLPYHWSLPSRPEGELYPGAVIMGLSIAGAIAAVRARKPNPRRRLQIALAAAGVVAAVVALASWASGGWHLSLAGLDITITRPHKLVTAAFWLLAAAVVADRRFGEAWRRRSVLLFFAVAAVVMMVLALGPTARAFDARFIYKAPYTLLMDYVPGGHALRVPARFGMLVALCLAQAAALAFRRFTPGGASTRVVAGVAMAIALEGWVPKLPMAPVARPIDLTGLDPNAAVIELPLVDPYSDTAAMLRSMQHRHPVVNGFSGYAPPYYGLLREGARKRDASIFAALQPYGSLLVLVNRSHDPEGADLAFLKAVPDATPVREIPEGTLFALPKRPMAPVDSVDPPLAIAGLTVTSGQQTLPLMTDGRVDTRWVTPKKQQPGDEVVVTFAQPVNVSRIELAMGTFGGDYPRQLRVTLSDPGNPPVTLFEGGVAGPMITAVMRDRVRTPMAIDLPAGPRGRELRLTLLAADEHVTWSIAELHVFGR